MPAITLPEHYGVGGGIWPPGHFWLIEAAINTGKRLFWTGMIAENGMGVWAATPDYAAGFKTQADAEAAFAQSGKKPIGCMEIAPFEHEWV